MDIKQLREKRAGIWKQMTDILVESEKRTAAPGETHEGQPLMTAEDRSKYSGLEGELEGLTAEIDTRTKHEATAARLGAPQGVEVAAFGNPADATGDPQSSYTEAFRSYVRKGMAKLDGETRSIIEKGYSQLSGAEQRDLGIGTGAAGGFMVPQGFLAKITEVLKYYGPVRSLANTIQTSSGQPLPWPGVDDTANVGAILGENTAITAQDVVVSTKTLNAFMYTSLLVKVSWQLLNDDAFDIETFLARKLGQRIGRIQNTHFTNGVGTTQPLGLLPGLLAGANKRAVMASGNTLNVSLNGAIDAIHAIDFAYRQKYNPTQGVGNLSTQGGPGSVGAGSGPAWMMRDATLALFRKLVDSQGRPLWQLAVNLGDPDTLLGYPVFVNPDIPAVGVSAVCAVFGNFDAAYLIRDVAGVQMVRLDERFADQLQAGFFAFCRTDAVTDDTNAAAQLVNSAT
jgi:HK97 family phage major capsid protein